MYKYLVLLLLYVSVVSAQVEQENCTVSITVPTASDWSILVETEGEQVFYPASDPNEEGFTVVVQLIGDWSWVYFVLSYPEHIVYVGFFECVPVIDEVEEPYSPPEDLVNYQNGEQIAGVYVQPDGTYHVYCVATGQIAYTVPERPELYTPCENTSLTQYDEVTWILTIDTFIQVLYYESISDTQEN